MSYLRKQMQYLKFDKRLLEINMKSGTITAEDYQNHLGQLEDVEAKSESIDLEGENNNDSENSNTEESAATTTPDPTEPVAPTINPAHSDPFGSGY